MKTVLSKLTIVSERLLKDELISTIKDAGASGYTLTAVEGEGSRGVRAGDWEGRNLMFETLVSDVVADNILDALNEKYFKNFAVVAWVTKVTVLRGEKFLGEHS